LVATEYVTKWAEAIATKNDDADTIARFLYENIITRFGCPKELVSDRGTHFINSTIEKLLSKYMIKHRKSTPYHPHANGQTEKTNGILCKIITKLFKDPIRIGTKEFLMLCGHIELLTKLPQKVHLSNLFMGKRLFYLLN
jgi:transposase InsO family protein